MSSYDFKITLYRDSLSTPWGFRLEGGRDFQSPLAVQRVFTGSPASADLQRGDIILNIQNRDASHLSHLEANDIIKHCGGSIQLTIRRGQLYSGSNTLPRMQPTYRPTSTVPFSSLPPVNRSLYNNNPNQNLFYAEDPLSNYIRSRPIEKVKDPKPILSQTGSPIMPGATPIMSSSSIKRYRPTHNAPLLAKLPTTSFEPKHTPYAAPIPANIQTHVPVPQYQNYNLPQSNPISLKFNNTNQTPVPFDKRMVNQIQQSLSKAIHSPKYTPTTGSSAFPAFYPHQPVSNQPSHPTSYTPVVKPPADYPDWRDSLKKTGLINYADQTQQINHNYHAGPSYPHVSSNVSHHNQDHHNQPKSPKVVNLQYNSPIGLYSKQNIQEELHKKVGNQECDFQLMASSDF